MDRFSVLCWNVRNPSKERAVRQIEWLRGQPEDVFVLTETKASAGCDLIRQHFQAQGQMGGQQYYVSYVPPERSEFGVMIVSKHPIAQSDFSVAYLNFRAAAVNVQFAGAQLEVVGTYVPSRDASPEKIRKKKRFLESLNQALSTKPASNRIFCGDLNVLEPNHEPHYGTFQAWEYEFYRNLSRYNLVDAFRRLNPHTKEYSWVGKTGDGYRYDYCFVSKRLAPALRASYYIHETRTSGLSDHSALVTVLEWGASAVKP